MSHEYDAKITARVLIAKINADVLTTKSTAGWRLGAERPGKGRGRSSQERRQDEVRGGEEEAEEEEQDKVSMMPTRQMQMQTQTQRGNQEACERRHR
ncbi:uncharacterized protein GLRG_07000 [Colletotrichum graminicola M1.001]|uniref:Uncharacterized protein n=1 Tax=Colletotrichum graminicola (strain M1.001 / M2 / FGSC 10212) TaxID=645133 RepID=E3QLW8_COLGM|nr:uncharacterized protein GLRG_07000 [Colletotrichum graminicola M1.001]EFQ31856.1 hypothetical protein GLRG_07000 [Colletotrichum graminicola M1.001]